MGKRQKRKKQTSGLCGGLGATSASTCRQPDLCMLVPNDMVGIIIGRGGSTIREIEKQTNVR